MSSAAYPSVSRWEYLDPTLSIAEPETDLPAPPSPATAESQRFTEEEVQARVEAALAQAHARWASDKQQQHAQLEDALSQQMHEFRTQRTHYFRSVETEVVHLVLGIARKILQREAALDPTLLRGLVHIAVDRLGTEAPVRLRVPSGSISLWQRAQAREDVSARLELVEDPTLAEIECVLESGSASAHFGLDSQLKEMEQSFQDLMAHRPGSLSR